MQALANDKNIRNDNWLSALVDAMDEVEAGRADDICRAVTVVPAGLMAQLQRHSLAQPRFNVVA